MSLEPKFNLVLSIRPNARLEPSIITYQAITEAEIGEILQNNDRVKSLSITECEHEYVVYPPNSMYAESKHPDLESALEQCATKNINRGSSNLYYIKYELI